MNTRLIRLFSSRLLLAGLGLLLAGRATAQPVIDTSYLKEMPAPDRISTDIRGTNALDTAARQSGAFYQLSLIVEDMSNGRIFRNQLTPEEAQMRMSYVNAMGRVQSQFNQQDTNRAVTRRNWGSLSLHYQVDESLHAEILNRYFSPGWQSNYFAIQAAQNAAVVNARKAAAEDQNPSKYEQAEALAEQRAYLKIIVICVFIGVSIGFIALIAAVSFLVFRGKAKVDSAYHKKVEGGATVFEVTPASAPISTFAFGLGIITFLFSWASVAAGLSDYSDPPYVVLSILFAMFIFCLGLFCMRLCRREARPKTHTFKTIFRVTPDAIETSGRTFNRGDIHRLMIKNGISNQATSASYVVLAPSTYAAGRAAGAADMARKIAVAYLLDLEAGGKAYMLAGGMDETTANGLLQDVCKIIGFKAN